MQKIEESVRLITKLGHAYSQGRLTHLVRTGAICVSPDGLRVAHLKTQGGLCSQLLLNSKCVAINLMHASGDARERAKLLGFYNSDAIVSAALSDGTFGVFLCGESGVTQISESEYVLQVRQSPSGVLILARSSNDQRRERRLIVPSLKTDIRVHDDSVVVGISSGRVVVLDWIDGQLYRYLVGPQGFEDVCSIPVYSYEEIKGIVRWNGFYVLGVQTSSHSELRFLGAGSWDVPMKTAEIEGELECLWQSPTQQTFAYLQKCIDEKGNNARRLVLGERVIYTGDFTMGDDDVVWSPDGRVIGARVWLSGDDGKHVSALISHLGSIRSTSSECAIDDFCVDNQGRFTGWIIKTGCLHTPIICGRKRHSVPFAWNLRQMADGSVRYNRVIGDTVENVTVLSG